MLASGSVALGGCFVDQESETAGETASSDSSGAETSPSTGLGSETGDTSNCPIGAQGCECTAGGGCDAGLLCAGTVCIPEIDCGNGVLDPGEQCDDGNDANDDDCLIICVDNVCGDGFLNASAEECDNGEANAESAPCTDACTIATCGDGRVCDAPGCSTGPMEGPEACDDGNGDNDDACLSTCAQARCGDGEVWAEQEECDDGPDNGNDAACLSTCEVARCGDGFIHAPVEQCEVGKPPPGSCSDLGFDQGTPTCDADTCRLAGCCNVSVNPCGPGTPCCEFYVCTDGFCQPE